MIYHPTQRLTGCESGIFFPIPLPNTKNGGDRNNIDKTNENETYQEINGTKINVQNINGKFLKGAIISIKSS
jgi:hypothetical protein